MAEAVDSAKAPALHVTVLLVQEQDAARDVRVEQLKALGIVVTVASTGHEALAALSQRRFDCAFCSQSMPLGVEGLETVKRLREFEAEHRPAAPPQQVYLLDPADSEDGDCAETTVELPR